MLGWVMDPLLRFDFALCERKSWVGWVALLATTNILSTQSHFFNSRPKMPEARMDEWALWYEAFQEAKAKGAPKSVKGLEVWFFEIFVKIGYGRLDWWIGSFTTCSWSLLLLFLLLVWLPPSVMSDNCLMMLCDSALVFAAIVCPFWKLRNIFPCKSPAWMAFRLQSTWLSRAVFAGSKLAEWSEDKKSRVSYHHRHNTNETRFVGICIEVASRRRGSTPWYITCHSHMVLLRMRVHSLQTVGELISAIKTAARAEDLNMMLAFNAEVRCGCP